MENLFRVAGLALIGCFLILLLKKDLPVYSFLLGFGIAGVILVYLITILEEARREVTTWLSDWSVDGTLVLCLFKVCLTSMVTRIASELCRDAGQGSLAYLTELFGTLSALIMALPVFRSLLKTVVELF